MSSQDTTLLNGRVKLTQSLNGLRASMDSVLLAAALSAKVDDRILDMGCGTGAVGLCAVGRLNDLNISLTGVDIQSDMINLAIQNAQENGIESAKYLTGDISDKTVFKAESFDHILMNPPYYEEGERLSSPDQAREKAFQSLSLDDWMAAALHWVKQGGSVTIIHRADKLDKILNLAHKKFGAIEIWPVHSKAGEPAIRVIVKMIRNRKTPLTLYPALTLFDREGNETKQANNIFRNAFEL